MGVATWGQNKRYKTLYLIWHWQPHLSIELIWEEFLWVFEQSRGQFWRRGFKVPRCQSVKVSSWWNLKMASPLGLAISDFLNSSPVPGFSKSDQPPGTGHFSRKLMASHMVSPILKLSNILFNHMFTCFNCARQNVAEIMEFIAGNVFVQIAEKQNSNTISFVSHSHSQRQKNKNIYVVFCSVTSVILSLF